ncbi:DUF3313 domain-containing protein [Pseudomonas atacamensis]|uniref:DUF3313 domain-containing protein n=1 Tax=Pseudomonas atacamensis TaxID=2565368 RepID=UPI001C3C3FAB|nr:DUF3313 domain-containing protein [Pseudomonas atacamensis]QXH74812.1 DUF3313 domain-containing protein [Pseudomonas atacamensis]
MNLSTKSLIGVCIAGLLVGGCTSRVTDETQYSGYLANYNNLQEVTTSTGGTTMRWVNPSWNPDAYDAVAFNRLELYPAPKPTERVNQQTLNDIQSHMTEKVRATLGEKYQIVSGANAAPIGSRTIIMRVAITGVSASNEGMKWYEVVPIAAVIGATQAAIGRRDQNTELYLEAELVDGKSNQTMVRVVRKVFGEQLSNENQRITAQEFKAAINKLNSDLWSFIRN